MSNCLFLIWSEHLFQPKQKNANGSLDKEKVHDLLCVLIIPVKTQKQTHTMHQKQQNCGL